MTTPRLLNPFVRTRTRLALTVGLLVAALVAAPLPWWLRADQQRELADAAPAHSFRDEATAMVEAVRTGKEVLVDAATSATSLTWALPDGQLRSTFHATPQRVKDATGRWTPIDTKLARSDNTPGGLDVRPVNPPTPVRFSGGSTADDPAADSVLAEMDVDGHTIAFIWPGRLPQPVLDGPRALYPDVLSGVDLLVVAREDGGFAQLLIVKNRAAATIKAASAITYGLRSQTAVFRHDPTTGGVRVLDRTGSREISSLPTPFAWDSAGRDPESPGAAIRTAVTTPADVLRLSGLNGSEPGARNAPIPTRLEGDGTGAVRLHLNAAGSGLLTSKDALFPIFLDPTLTSGQQAWATVYAQHPTTNTWNGTNFNSGTTEARVGYDQSTPLRTRSFWRMGFDSKLKNAKASAATFKILNTHSWSCTNREMQLWLTGAISSGTTWNAQPKWTTLQQKKSFAYGYTGCAQDYASFNVQDAAQQALDAGSSTITLGMQATSESDTLTWRKFKVSTAELSVTYNRPPNTPTGVTSDPGGNCVPGPGNGVTIAKTNIVLSATATDPDSNLKALHFRFWKNGTTAPADTVVTASSSGKASLTIPSTTLEDRATYLWDVRAEDTSGALSGYYPATQSCRLTIDNSKPSKPQVTSDVFKEFTPDGETWATVKLGQAGPVTFTSTGATKFKYTLDGANWTEVTTTTGTYTKSDLRPRHAGPTTIQVYAFNAVGNQSDRKDYTFYLPPRDAADGPGDTNGDNLPDLLIVDTSGNLRNYAGDEGGALDAWLAASYTDDGRLNPPGHWYDPATGKAALITKYADAYPGDGLTDLFARTPDGGFWLYPGDGYGSFNVDRRIRVLLPPNAPDPATWTQIKAVGDITGDKLPDLALRAGTAFWVLSGYTGASFQTATLMEGSAWARREIVNVADIDLDGTPDLLWRNLDNGNMYVRHGKPGSVLGSVNLDSLKTAANSRDGDVSYGTGWSEANISALVAIPDVNGDRVPDLWARSGTDGQMRIYYPSKTNVGNPVRVVLGEDLRTHRSFG
ncbi:hypothetical protein ABZ671_16025 [Micromonospora sp. NPDC006766]|uniref:hypothetical protein n=1 Tax=Micromonospora sp. NPDC006766 TaxID=3154778 RepID=UPI0033F142C2